MTPAGRPAGPIILALDVGTTGVKGVAFDLASPWRHVAIREYPLLEPQPGWQVQDPEPMMSATAAAAAECTAVVGGAEVVAVAVSTAMHGLLALDAAMRPLTPLITWADARATQEAQFLRTSGQAGELHRTTGAPIHPMTPLTKLMWFSRHEPHTWARARWWVGLMDYLLYRMTGTLVTELSSASGTGGAFRAPLWREVMAASLNRPLHMVAAAEGSALGAAALGLLALSRATQLTDAVDQLTWTDHASEVRIDPDEAKATTYDEVRRSIPRLVAGLNTVASLFVGEPAASTHHERP